MGASPMCNPDLLTRSRQFRKNRPADVSGPLACNPGVAVDQRFVSIFLTAFDGLSLHVRKYGCHVTFAIPVVCLPSPALQPTFIPWRRRWQTINPRLVQCSLRATPFT